MNYHDLAPQKYWSFPASFKGDKKAETKNMIFSGDYIGARKMDGAFYKFVKNNDGSMELLGRSKSVNGDFLNKIDWVPQLHDYFKMLPNNTCLIGELYFPNNEGSNHVTTIMGCLKDKAITRQETGEKLHYYIFDVLQLNGEDIYTKDIEYRIEILNSLEESQPYIEFAHYYEGLELWNELQSILLNGGEGVVITKKGTHYQPDKRPARQTLKIKKELKDTIDVVVMGANAPTRIYTGKEIETWKYWEDPVTKERFNKELFKDYSNGKIIEPITKPYYNNWAGSLNIGVYKDDKLVQIGSISGLTEDILMNWRDYVGKVVEVTAMQITDDKALRHPRVVGFRPDKNAKECLWSQLE